MSTAVLYDIHGNLPALEAVLSEIARIGVDTVVCGGDVFPGPMGSDCLHALRALDLPVRFVMGNGDREVLAARAGRMSDRVPLAFREAMQWCASRLTDDDAETIATWPATVSFIVPGAGPVLFCHATPHDDTTAFTHLTPKAELGVWMDEVKRGALVICGHTHMQFDRTARGVRIVNAGSVGMPFGEPRAHWLLLADDVSLRRTDYDLNAAAIRIRATEYPQAESFASVNVLNPPTESEMLERFTPAG